MEPVEVNDPEKIQEMLRGIVLTGSGFVTACLLEDVWDAGLTYPDLRMSGTPVSPIPTTSRPEGWTPPPPITATPPPGRPTTFARERRS